MIGAGDRRADNRIRRRPHFRPCWLGIFTADSGADNQVVVPPVGCLKYRPNRRCRSGLKSCEADMSQPVRLLDVSVTAAFRPQLATGLRVVRAPDLAMILTLAHTGCRSEGVSSTGLSCFARVTARLSTSQCR